ncbi:MAG: tetratricopeptide repeat protein [Thermodesulfobacteriota bacterium]|nr:tetratricopeptide repeat protein [Thermodesulfobacteriota bacterium]
MPENKIFSSTRVPLLCTIAIIVLTGILIYSNTFGVPFVFDDVPNIIDNPHIRMTALTPEQLADAVQGPAGHRPLAYLSFAFNYFFHEYHVFGYHLINLIIHLITGLLVFLTARQTLRLTGTDNRFIPVLAAVLWLVSPVHTQAVTYIVQRMTAMATMFYLLALFLYIKARIIQTNTKMQTKRAALFFVASLLSWICALGAKEIAATLPVFVFLYEWFFFQNLDTDWLRRQTVWILGLCVVVTFIAFYYLGTTPLERILKVYNYRDFTLVQRLLTEPRIVLYYLSLLAFPHPGRLNLNYYISVSTSLINPVTTLFSILALIAFFAVAIISAKKNRLLSFAILWYLGNLVIESSFIGLELIFEHRAYLPSIFVFIATTALLTSRDKRASAVTLLCALIIISGFWTYQRNKTWADKISLWGDASAKASRNPRPHNNLGMALQKKGLYKLAMEKYKKAISVDPTYENAYNNMGFALLENGSPDEAIPYLITALKIRPTFKDAHNNIAVAYHRTGNTEKAIAHCKTGLAIDPDFTKIRNTLGVIYLGQSKLKQAADCFTTVLKSQPGLFETNMNMGLIRQRENRPQKAADFFETAVALNPNSVEAHYHLGSVLAMSGDLIDARHHIEVALKIKPDYPQAHNALGNILLKQGEIDKAITYYQKALQYATVYASASINLANALSMKREYNAAIASLNEALPQAPENPSLLSKLGMLYSKTEKYDEAIDVFKTLGTVLPGNATVFYNIACLYAKQNNTEKAVENLKKAIEKGYASMERIKTDPDLEAIRNTDYYKQLTSQR